MGSAIVVAPLLYLDPTYFQISSTLHISLSELEQVALNFTSWPSSARSPPGCRPRLARRTDAVLGSLAVRMPSSTRSPPGCRPRRSPHGHRPRLALRPDAAAVLGSPRGHSGGLRADRRLQRAFALTSGSLTLSLAFRIVGQPEWLFLPASGASGGHHWFQLPSGGQHGPAC